MLSGILGTAVLFIFVKQTRNRFTLQRPRTLKRNCYKADTCVLRSIEQTGGLQPVTPDGANGRIEARSGRLVSNWSTRGAEARTISAVEFRPIWVQGDHRIDLEE